MFTSKSEAHNVAVRWVVQINIFFLTYRFPLYTVMKTISFLLNVK